MEIDIHTIPEVTRYGGIEHWGIAHPIRETNSQVFIINDLIKGLHLEWYLTGGGVSKVINAVTLYSKHIEENPQEDHGWLLDIHNPQDTLSPIYLYAMGIDSVIVSTSKKGTLITDFLLQHNIRRLLHVNLPR